MKKRLAAIGAALLLFMAARYGDVFRGAALLLFMAARYGDVVRGAARAGLVCWLPGRGTCSVGAGAGGCGVPGALSLGLHCMWFLFLALVFVTGLVIGFLQSAGFFAVLLNSC